jgi:hypothetical protein
MSSRNGETWERLHEPFLDRSHTAGAWDHAMAWISGAFPMQDELFLYYGGYARGHKVEASRERQIGLARMKRDRYVARRADREGGRLVTPPVLLKGTRLTLNADARGEIRLRLLDLEGRPLSGAAPKEGGAVRGDSLAHAAPWRGSLAPLRERPVRLEFRLRDADLYGFDLS